MANTVRRVEYFYTFVTDRPGAGAKIMNVLKNEGVNLVAYTGFPVGPRRSQLDFVPSDKRAFRAAARKAGIQLVGPKTAFLIDGDDRTGAVAEILGKLADAKINVTAMDAVAAGAGRYGAILWVKPRSVRKATDVLGAS